MANDLTWEQVNVALGTNAISVVGGSVVLNISTLTGDAVSAMTSTGVVEACIKFLRGCAIAQETVNAAALPGQRLNSFPTPSFGTPFLDTTAVPAGYYATITASVTGRAPLDVNLTSGPQI